MSAALVRRFRRTVGFYLRLAVVMVIGSLAYWGGPAHAAATTVTFRLTNSAQTWTVLPGVTSATFKLYGGQGGNGAQSGGNGGVVQATLSVTPGTLYTLCVGGAGKAANDISGSTLGGFNGGGSRLRTGISGVISGTGGGASDVRLQSVTPNCLTPQSSSDGRILVAAGGGGGAGNGFTSSGGTGGSAGFAGAPGGNSSLPFGGTAFGGGPGGAGSAIAGGAGGTSAATGGEGQQGSLGEGGNVVALAGTNAGDGGAGGGGYFGGGSGGAGQSVSTAATGGGGGGGGSNLLGLTGTNLGATNNGDGKIEITYTPPGPTTVTNVSGSGVVGGNANLTATLTSSGSPVAGKSMTFKLNGNGVGSATTDSSGVATLSNVDIAGLAVGTYVGAVEANFAGDSSFGGSSGVGDLTVSVRETFNLTDSTQSWTVPAGVSLATFKLYGGKGGDGDQPGGNGAVVQASLSVTPGDVYTLCVGGAGKAPSAGGGSATGGFNGGGAGAVFIGVPGEGGPGSLVNDTASGGGASDIRLQAGTPDCSTDLSSRLLIAGGGGAGGSNSTSNSSGGLGGAAGADGSPGQDATLPPDPEGGGGGVVPGGGPGGAGTATGGGAGGSGGNTGTSGLQGSLGLGADGVLGPGSLFAGAGNGGPGGGGLYGGGSGGSGQVDFTSVASGGGGGGGGSNLLGANGASLGATNAGDGKIEITYVPEPLNPTAIENVAGTGTYSETATLSATLTSNGTPLVGRSVSFKLNDVGVGSADTDSNGVATLSSVNLGSIGAGTYTGAVKASFAGDSSYDLSDGVGDLVVGKASQSISFTSAAPSNAVVGDTYTPTATGGGSGNPVTFAASGACSYDGTLVTMDSAGTCTVSANQAGSSNYDPAPPESQQFSVSAAILPTSTSGVSGSGVYAGTATLSATLTSNGNPLSGQSVSFKLNDVDVGSATTDSGGVATLSSVNIDGINAGTYSGAVKANFAGDSAYAPSDGVGDLVVGKASQTISFTSTAPNNAVVGDTYTPTATGGGSANPVTFAASGACTFSGGIVTMTTAGTCTVSANQAGNANYDPAPQVDQVFAVGVSSTSTTTTLVLTPSTQQYSDRFNLSASVSPANAPGKVQFRKSIDGGVTYANLNGSIQLVNGAASLANQQVTDAAGTPVFFKAIYTPSSSAFQTSSDSKPLTITKEDATVSYAGPSRVTLKKNSTSTNVKLMAAVAEANDGSLGSLKLAQVEFLLYRSTNVTRAVPDATCQSTSGVSKGQATCSAKLGIDNWAVIVHVAPNNLYYTSPLSAPAFLLISN